MSRAQELLDAATPLPWRTGAIRTHGIYGNHPDDSALATVRHWEPSKAPMDDRASGDAALIVYAVNTLPAYEAVVEVLESIVAMADGFDAAVDPTSEWAQTIDHARAALARLRDEVPA